MDELQKCLKNMAVFSRLEDSELKLLCRHSTEMIHNGGKVIFFENDSIKKLYMLVEGRVKLSMLSPAGKEKVMTILQEGDIFGEISLFNHDPHPLTAEVVDRARVLIISRSDLEAIIMQHPSLAIKIIAALSRKTRLLTSQVRELVFQDAAGRLAGLILRFAGDFGVSINDKRMIELVLTHQEIANLLGTSRVTVTKLMNEFIDEGIIKMYKRKIVIIDKNRLEEKIEGADQ